MATRIDDKEVFSLLEVTMSIQKTILARYTRTYWIRAEMNKLNLYPTTGHCFPELVQKKDGRVIAQIRGIIWQDNFLRINQNFLNVLKEPLKNGITILFSAKINFTPVHGICLSILEIDPSYTLGELEKEKQETINRLKNELLFTRNRETHMPLLPKRIAVISVETSKGYSDFMNILKQRSRDYAFFTMLFPALLQGEKAVESIIFQLRQIKKVLHHFDVVAIIRGGGGDVGLSSYNHYHLAKAIASFPIPVLTGIGHSTNETVSELVAYMNAITPTELADYLIQKFHDFSTPLQRAIEVTTTEARNVLLDNATRFTTMIRHFRLASRNMLSAYSVENKNLTAGMMKLAYVAIRREKDKQIVVQQYFTKGSKRMIADAKSAIVLSGRSLRKDAGNLIAHSCFFADQSISNFSKTTKRLTSAERSIIDHFEQLVRAMDPKQVMKRGYAYMLVNKKLVTTLNDIKRGDLITSVLLDGEVYSKVESINKNSNE